MQIEPDKKTMIKSPTGSRRLLTPPGGARKQAANAMIFLMSVADEYSKRKLDI
jgi:hypothetical protein